MSGRDDTLLSLQDAFEDALSDILGHHAPLARPPDPLADAGIDLLVRIGDVTLAIEVKAAPTVADVHRLANVPVPGDAYKVLAGGRISQAVREELREAGIGFYDARGHLRLMHPPLRIDAPVRSVAEDTATPRGDPLASSGGLDIALCLLDQPDFLEHFSGRRLAAAVDRAPSTVSNILKALRDDYLLDDRKRPIVPDLFQAVLRHWNPQRIPLGGMPRPGQGRLNDRLELGLDAPFKSGWALADRHAAAAWGAPVVLHADTPPDFYVPSTRVVSAARTSFGTAAYGDHACTIAVAPAPFVVRFRSDLAETIGLTFPVVRPAVAALDLAADPGRGSETLELWSERLDSHITRVW